MNKFWQVAFTSFFFTGSKVSYVYFIYTEDKDKLDEFIEREKNNIQKNQNNEVDVKITEGIYSHNFQLNYDDKPLNKNDFKILSSIVI